MAKSSCTPEDKTIGTRVRIARLQRGMSQSALADQLGVSFQQVQKYEKGTNRIGGSRLAQIALALGVPVASFFEEVPISHQPEGDLVMGMLTAPHGMDMARAFIGLSNLDRITLVQLAERFVRIDAGKPAKVRKAA